MFEKNCMKNELFSKHLEDKVQIIIQNCACNNIKNNI